MNLDCLLYNHTVCAQLLCHLQAHYIIHYTNIKYSNLILTHVLLILD